MELEVKGYYKVDAKNDEDFKELWNYETFKKLVN
jgi:hypothetical protein